MGLFSSKNKTISLEEMLTPEQKSAQTQLMNLGQLYSGLGDFNFGTTGIENLGLTGLENYVGSGTPQGLTTASNVLTQMANQEFNPDDPSSGFAAYQRQVARAGKTASDQINREAAITGSRFGTGIQREKTDLAAQQSDLLSSKLAELWKATQSNKLSAAQGLGQVEQLNNAIQTNKLQAAFQYGGLQRDLQNQQAQLKYDEWKRANEERISGLQSVWGRNVDYGMKSYSWKEPSTAMAMWGESNPLVGSYNTHQYGYTTNQTSINQMLKQLAGGMSGGAGGMGGA